MGDPLSTTSDGLEAVFTVDNGFPYPAYSKNYRRGSYGAMRVAARFFAEDTTDEKRHHFLDSCAHCMKPLHPNRDIYMYRGDMPFCSEECRQEQIEMDEAMEMSKKVSVKKASAAINGQNKSNVTSPPKPQCTHVGVDTAVAC